MVETAGLYRQILMIFLEMGAGALAARVGLITPRDSKFLSALIMSVTLPCSLLASAGLDAAPGTVVLMLEGAALLELLFVAETVLCKLAAKILRLTPGQYAVFIGATVLPNGTFIGIPLATAVLGNADGMVYAAAGMIAYNLYFFTYVVHLFEPEKKLAPKSFITPTNLATVAMVAMLLAGVCLPGAVQDFTVAVGNCTTPLALMLVGVTLSRSDLRAVLARPVLYLITLLRCIAWPLAFMLLLWLLPLDRTMCMGVTIIAACPCGSLVAVLAEQHETEAELASQAVAQSTLAILVTVPVLLQLATKLFGLG